MQDVMSSVVMGISEANGLLQTAAVSTSSRFGRDQKQEEEQKDEMDVDMDDAPQDAAEQEAAVEEKEAVEEDK